MNFLKAVKIRQVGRLARHARNGRGLLAVAAWNANSLFAWAQQRGQQQEEEPSRTFALSYALVGLFIVLGLMALLRPSLRYRDSR